MGCGGHGEGRAFIGEPPGALAVGIITRHLGINEILSILRDGLRAEISFLFVECDIRRRWSLQVMNANYERLTRVGQP